MNQGEITTEEREAGAVMLGKTNMNEFAAGISGTNKFYGDTRNPWALDRSPGGSSSGTGAAIAAELGTMRVTEQIDALTTQIAQIDAQAAGSASRIGYLRPAN